MQQFLQRLTPEQLAEQHSLALAEVAAETQRTHAAAERRQLLARKPGRPRRALPLQPPLPEPDEPPQPASAAKRPAHHHNWLGGQYGSEILEAYRKTGGSARKAVQLLQRTNPQRYAELSESTVRSWHDENGQLKEKLRSIVHQQLRTVPRGRPPAPLFAEHRELEQLIKDTLMTMRSKGATVNIMVIRLIMRAMLADKAPNLAQHTKFSSSFIGEWARNTLGLAWRHRTTAASKLPDDWRAQGVLMAKRIACAMQLYKVHPSLVINMDQTGVHLAPADSRTYEVKGAKQVSVICAEDKRQITACVASSLDGDLLPLQLIFQGKTDACHPSTNDAARKAQVHLTHSENHWSNQATMQQWIDEVLVPYRDRRIVEHNLPAESHIVLVLDVWTVHKSEEFRKFIRTHHPRVHLVYVPPSCTSKLQVADVILQRPFKHALRQEFNMWAAEILREQIRQGDLLGLNPYLKMSVIKPLTLQWCVTAWNKMHGGREYIKMGWHTCVLSQYNVHDQAKRLLAVEEKARDELDANFVPEEEEGTTPSDCDSESDFDDIDDIKDVLDVMKQRQYGTRKSERKRPQTALFGYTLNSQQIAMTDDSES